MRVNAGIGGVLLQAKEYSWPPETRKRQEGFSPRASRERVALPSNIDLGLPVSRIIKTVVLGHQPCGNL